MMFKTKQQQRMPKPISSKYADVYCDVMVTNNYDLFSYVDGNRPIRKPHLKSIHDSIAAKQIPVPNVVDEHYRICDGQNRYEACQMLDKPVYYIVIPGLTLEDIQRLNANTKTWSPDDFLDSYCEQGLPEYKKYKGFKEKYGFGHSECLVILGGWKIKKRSKNINQNFKDGNFKIIDYVEAVNVSDKITKVKQYFDGYKNKCFVMAMLRLFKNPEYDHNKFLSKLETQSEKMKKQANTDSYLTLIEEIYNFRSRDKVRLFTY